MTDTTSTTAPAVDADVPITLIAEHHRESNAGVVDLGLWRKASGGYRALLEISEDEAHTADRRRHPGPAPRPPRRPD